jgi:hypothetical protein
MQKKMKGLLTDGEPTLKRPKIKIHAPKNAQLWLSLQEWLMLVFGPYLSLVELVQMKRVCKSFATHAGLKDLIALKINSAFGGLPDRHWNKLANMTKNPVLEQRHDRELIEIAFFSKHLGKYLLIVDYHQRKSGRFQLAAFSSYARLEVVFANHFSGNDDVRLGVFWNDGDDLESKYENDELLQFPATFHGTGENFILYLFGRLPNNFFWTYF